MKKSYKVAQGIDKFLGIILRSILLSLLVVVFNLPLLLFILTYNGPLDLISGTIITLLTITVFPSYTSALNAARQDSHCVSNFFKFYKSNLKFNYQVSLIFVLAFTILIVDAIFFKLKDFTTFYYMFLGLSVLAGLLFLNTGLLVSSFDLSLKNLLILNLENLSSLSVSSSAFVLIMLIPFKVDILIYLIVIGLSLMGQNYVYSSKLDNIKNRITDPQIKYL